MGAQPISDIRKYTVQEYLDLERDAETKSEYYNGYIVAMAGANPPHNLISISLAAMIFGHLRGKGCSTYSADQRVWIDEVDSYVYPDLTVVCVTPEYNDDNPPALLNPTLVVEILSPSTKDWDQRNKLELYQEHPTLQEVLFVDSSKPYMGGFYKKDGRWDKTSSVYHPDKTYRLESIGLDLNLAEVYGSVLESFGPINPITLRRES